MCIFFGFFNYLFNFYILLSYGCFRSLGQTSPCLSAFAAGRAAAYKMFETIERKPVIDAFNKSGKVLDDLRGDIELKDVYFSYPTRPDEQIFNGFSLCIPSGMTAALVGQSGSGKSTVISLIERFYDPQVGEVLIDNINLKEFQLKWIRGKIGLVSQEPVLFGSSIKDNIAYGNDGATIEEIRAAAELANATKFIDKLPQVLILTLSGPCVHLQGPNFIYIYIFFFGFFILLVGTRYHGW
jgi:ATP-binding cassette subfamily B (MDR/TAP) protein 1